MFRGIHVRVLNQNDQFVSFIMTSSSSKKRMRKKEFYNKVKQGVYEVKNLKGHIVA